VVAAALMANSPPARAAGLANASSARSELSHEQWQWRKPEPPRPIVFGAVGLGYPELVNARLGLYVLSRLTLEGVYGLVNFNHMAGGGLTVYLFGQSRENAPPTSSFALSVYLRNNMFRELGIEAVRDKLGITAELGGGYAYHADNGLLLRTELLVLASPDRHGATMLPLFRLSAGWTFPFQTLSAP
jgi:hypothetical protein